MKQILSCCLALLLMNSCINLSPPDKQIRYIDSYTSFEPEYVDHIPKRQPKLLNSYYFSNPLYPDNTRVAYFVVSEEVFSSKKYFKIKEDYISRALYSRSSSDNCFTLINSIPSVNDVYTREGSDSFMPIPYQVVYKENYITKELTRFENYEIHILELKKGMYLEGDRSVSIEVFPKGWDNGLSKGISFNDERKFIIYWTIIW